MLTFKSRRISHHRCVCFDRKRLRNFSLCATSMNAKSTDKQRLQFKKIIFMLLFMNDHRKGKKNNKLKQRQNILIVRRFTIFGNNKYIDLI